MIIIPFPITDPRDFAMEMEVCKWIGQNRDIADLSDRCNEVVVRNEEVAVYFRLKFGL